MASTTSVKSYSQTRPLVEGAVMVALAQILSLFPFYSAPYGGSIDAAMLPVIFFAVRWGLKWGLGASFVFGFLQYIVSYGFAISWISIIGDYLIAFTMLGLAGLFRGRKYGIFWGCIVASAARFIVHFITGITIWAQYMPETFTNIWVYSAVYNGSYMLPDLIIILALSVLLYKPLKRYMLGEDILRK